MPASSESRFRVSVMLDPTGGASFTVDLGDWDTFDGGDPMAAVNKRADAYSAGRKVATLPGPVDTSDITVTRQYQYERDQAVWRVLNAFVGRASVKVVRQPLDADYNLYGAPDVYTSGKLSDVTQPKADTDSATTAMLMFKVVGSVLAL